MMSHAFYRRLPLVLLLCCAPVAGVAASPLDDATRALDEGVPGVAVLKIQEQLARPGALNADQRREAKTRLAEALLAVGRAEEALKTVREPEVRAPLLEGRILAAMGKWDEALAVYGRPELAGEIKALSGKAECLNALGRRPEAIAVLKSIAPKAPAAVSLRLAELLLEAGQPQECAPVLAGLNSALNDRDRKWKEYINARLLLLAGKHNEAFARFQALQEAPADISNGMMVGITLGMTDSRTELTNLNAADDILEQYIWKPEHEQDPSLGILFRKLDMVYSGETNPSLAELQKWAQRDPAIRAGYATYYWAKGLARDHKPEAALDKLRNFAGRFPGHPMLARALLMKGSLCARLKQFSQAQQAFDAALQAAPSPDLRGEIELASAGAHFAAGEFVLAATVYRSAGEDAPRYAEMARYNTALAWLHQGNFARFAREYQCFSSLYPDSPLRPGLVLEEGLLRARQQDPRAENALEKFIHDFPGNPRVADARLALAELHYMGGQPQEASRYLQVVNESPAPVSTAEGADFLAIFVAEAAQPVKDSQVIALCRAFIARHPQPSDRLAEVRMKLGQVYFRSGDFASAQTQFQTLADENPTSPLKEAALFLAGQSSMQRINGIDQAIALFGKVVALNGPFKLNARLHLAQLQKRLGNDADAVAIYADILKATPQGEVKWAAMAGEADSLVALANKDPRRSEQALALYRQLAAEPGIGATILHRALYNQGHVLEIMGRPEEALAAYYQVVDEGSANPQEYFWYYKAGFDACRLCEKREQWKSAIAIYRKMAAVEGPRAGEAKAQMDHLRLEHFIWDDNQ